MRHTVNTFALICVLLACYMTTKETLRYFKNEDQSSIGYKYFAASPQDTYPTFSICILDEQEEGLIYSYFKLDIALTFPMTDADSFSSFAKILKGNKESSTVKNEDGDSIAELDIRNFSENYANSFTFKLAQLCNLIKFETENSNDSLDLDCETSTSSMLPFYVSYQDPDTICFTRNNDKKEGIVRIEDTYSLVKSQLDKFDNSVKIKIFVHHPGQLLRGFNAPIFQSTLRDFDWERASLTFTISQVSILRKRPSGNIPCDSEVNDDDYHLIEKVSEKVGCIPIYWKNILYVTSNLELCKTPDELKKVQIELDDFSRTKSTYLPPCNEMRSAITTNHQKRRVMSFTIKYLDRSYEEIINEREFGLESLWSTVGGFIGIFIGTSLVEVPSLVITAWNWIWNLQNKK